MILLISGQGKTFLILETKLKKCKEDIQKSQKRLLRIEEHTNLTIIEIREFVTYLSAGSFM